MSMTLYGVNLQEILMLPKQLTSIWFFCRGQHFGVGLHHRGDRRRQVEVRGQHESPRQ